jgi:hypothetical protein
MLFMAEGWLSTMMSEGDSLRQYLTAIDSEPRLDHVSFPRQLAQARHGDQVARSLILGSSLRTASTAAHEWATTRGRLIDLDMIQEANAALVSTFEHFSGWKLDEFSVLVEREVLAHLDRLYEQ